MANCETGKVGYLSPQSAWDAARRMSNRKGKPLEGNAYLCKFCGEYHFTRLPASGDPKAVRTHRKRLRG